MVESIVLLEACGSEELGVQLGVGPGHEARLIILFDLH
jgi:hypothetical protein